MSKNMAKCALCGDIVESTFRHDFISCKCGEIFVDGGDDYYRAGAKDPSNFIPLHTPEQRKDAGVE
jgi:hypothetical protein